MPYQAVFAVLFLAIGGYWTLKGPFPWDNSGRSREEIRRYGLVMIACGVVFGVLAAIQ